MIAVLVPVPVVVVAVWVAVAVEQRVLLPMVLLPMFFLDLGSDLVEPFQTVKGLRSHPSQRKYVRQRE